MKQAGVVKHGGCHINRGADHSRRTAEVQAATDAAQRF
jgi:hypothetical protein